MIIGFTGTQEGMTKRQRREVYKLFKELHDDPDPFGLNHKNVLHHGDCVGADDEAHTVSEELPEPMWYWHHGHPPVEVAKRAWRVFAFEEEPKPYLERNRDIVMACEVLIATPKTADEELRSGTWATVRYARKASKPVIIVNPDGVVKYNNAAKRLMKERDNGNISQD